MYLVIYYAYAAGDQWGPVFEYYLYLFGSAHTYRRLPKKPERIGVEEGKKLLETHGRDFFNFVLLRIPSYRASMSQHEFNIVLGVHCRGLSRQGHTFLSEYGRLMPLRTYDKIKKDSVQELQQQAGSKQNPIIKKCIYINTL